ncbi:hypothetical protein RGQ29_017417 [Quercus rubra]|uniref:F-box domain-containing protein n=1 Tax=Quercus rubra TaxID=3512 RepID=A0AAN7J0V8_QUERU|nr:hypothetical protein RGQ29_017417 [Quercus rubra]
MRESRPQPLILQWRKNHLPYDIVLNILERLHVKSVIRFKFVCKFWDSLITTPYFISSHLNVNNKDSHDNANDISLNSIRMVGSCNGLLCFANYGPRKAIYFCNPSIRKFKTLPEPCLGHLKHVSLGFAYHYENNDYKVVRISSSPWMSTISLPEIEVYTLSSDSWRSVGIEFTTNVMVYDYNFHFSIPLVSGALHWLAHIKEGEEKQGIDIIMAFDVNTLKFRKLAVLPHLFSKTNPCDRYLTSFKRKLALAFITFRSGEHPSFPSSIWVMKEYGVVESWIKPFVMPIERVALCIAFTEHGSLLTWSINNQVENHGSK